MNGFPQKNVVVPSLRFRARAFYRAGVALLLCLAPTLAQEAKRTEPLKIGIYENRPMVFIDRDGKPAGFQVDIIQAIAADEKWPIAFVNGTWQECLNRLEDGEIDLLLDIGYSEERAQKFDFTTETIFSTWAQIYTPAGSSLRSIPDLAGTHIAVMTDDVHYAALKRLLHDFGIKVTYDEYDEYKDLMQAVEHHRADAGLFSRIAGLQLEDKYAVQRSPIVLDPIQVRIGFPKEKNADIREAIDADLRKQQADPDSVYNKSMDKWLGSVLAPGWPWWWKWAVAAAGAAVLIAFVVTAFLRVEVRRKTAQLRANNIELEREVESRARVERLLQAGRDRLALQSRVLMNLARSEAVGHGELDAALKQITAAAVQALDIERASVWSLDEDHSAIRCMCLYVRSKNEYFKGSSLSRKDYPSYFDALGENRIIAASNATQDPRTREFTVTYLNPLGIKSMLDAPIRIGSRLVGILCNEHVGLTREWALEEEQFAASLADFAALTLDAHERMEAENRLRESEERNRLILERALDAVIITDERGVVIGWNARAEQTFGYPRAEAIGKPVISLIVPERVRGNVVKEFQEILRTQRGRTRRDALAMRKNGEEFYAEFSVSAARQGKKSVFTAFIRDNTEQKRAQEMKERLKQIESEFELARTIQGSFLPQKFPAFPNRHEFEVYAEMIPAADVGGDFFDFYLLDQDRLAFAIGDVSGKGVAGAIVMAMTLTLLKASARSTKSVSECLARLNQLLCEENEATFFVTLFYGVLHIPTGWVQYANAGHPTPYRLSPIRGVEPLEMTGGLVLGLFPTAEFMEGEVQLKNGESILLYTDGVTEAMNEAQTLYSEDRLVRVLEGVDGSASPLIKRVVQDVAAFAGDAAQHDDITMLALRYLV